MSGKHILITGANAGIGRAAAGQLAAAGHKVWLGCRSVARGEPVAAEIRAAGGDASVLEIDMASRASIRAAVDRLDAVDVVVHNAAFFDISVTERLRSPDGVELTWATNHLGPALLTDALLPKLRDSAQGRVLVISSKGLAVHPFLTVNLEDPELLHQKFSVQNSYYHSKLAQIAWMRALAEELADSRITVHGVRVTNVRIDTDRYPNLPKLALWAYGLKMRFAITPEEMAKTYTWLATGEAGPSGGYWDAIQTPAPLSRWARDLEHCRAVMSLTRAALA